jgi:hypothetical protein
MIIISILLTYIIYYIAVKIYTVFIYIIEMLQHTIIHLNDTVNF